VGISERKKREREQRRHEILDAAESLFFSREYDKVSMDDIAALAELNKATIYLYFRNKEDLFAAVVLRGYVYLNKFYRECAETQVTGIHKIGLMAGAYYRFNRQFPNYLRMIRYYASERFNTADHPASAAILEASAESRNLIFSAVQQGIEDGTIRDDLNPLEITLYLMITFMSILSLAEKWRGVLDEHGISDEKFAQDFIRFIIPAVDRVAAKEKPRVIDMKIFECIGGFLNDPIVIDPIRKR
jgi:AcrR family transcriptional regulator